MRSKLPHFDEPLLVQFITYRLADSLPLEARLRLKELPEERRTARIQDLLDQGTGACHLMNPGIASIVQENLLHFDGEKYFALAWCIMPNHVHTLIHIRPGFSLPKIVQGWKSYTSKACNAVLGRT
jgi:putative transposase